MTNEFIKIKERLADTLTLNMVNCDDDRYNPRRKNLMLYNPGNFDEYGIYDNKNLDFSNLKIAIDSMGSNLGLDAVLIPAIYSGDIEDVRVRVGKNFGVENYKGVGLLNESKDKAFSEQVIDYSLEQGIKVDGLHNANLIVADLNTDWDGYLSEGAMVRRTHADYLASQKFRVIDNYLRFNNSVLVVTCDEGFVSPNQSQGRRLKERYGNGNLVTKLKCFGTPNLIYVQSKIKN